ncbi:MAG TPA: HepT-like ribonuclease domain-containing protein [Vicinamibacterales bacterium]|nr:HepT-like ribonuclease domain-containing protein [Vicinamibacterales bacterium]
MLEAMARIERYVAGLTFEPFQADEKTIDAVVRNLEIICGAPKWQK